MIDAVGICATSIVVKPERVIRVDWRLVNLEAAASAIDNAALQLSHHPFYPFRSFYL